MADKPILMSGPMVRAILREIEQPGTGKTKTRRVIKPQPVIHDSGSWRWEGRNGGFVGSMGTHISSFPESAAFHARFRPRDRLYVREAWRTHRSWDQAAPRDIIPASPIQYEAGPLGVPMQDGKFRQGMHMPRWASRITLIVKAVKVERLQDISEEDAIAEGVYFDGALWTADGINYGNSPIDAFQCLWLSIHGDDAWSDNPWIVAISFDPILANIDSLSPEIDVNKMRSAK